MPQIGGSATGGGGNSMSAWASFPGYRGRGHGAQARWALLFLLRPRRHTVIS